MKAFHYYKKNLLPNGTSWGKESFRFMEAMTILENEYTKIENEQIKNARK